MMPHADHLNAVFEGGGAVLQLLNIRQLLRDRTVRGVHWAPLSFWTAWGYWNALYYPSLGQWWSFVGGLGVVACNSVNLLLMWRFWPRSHRCERCGIVLFGAQRYCGVECIAGVKS